MDKVKKVSDYNCIVYYPDDWYCAKLDRSLIRHLIKLRDKHGSCAIRGMLDKMDRLDEGITTKEEFDRERQKAIDGWEAIRNEATNER